MGEFDPSRRNLAPGADRRPFSSGVEEFQVHASGGVWVAAGARCKLKLLLREATSSSGASALRGPLGAPPRGAGSYVGS
jgi:hypothetical protein